jgi:hypothetical protein
LWGGSVDLLAEVLANSMTALFIAGAAGCALVIPVVAYRLFSVLFERDQQNPETGMLE